MSKILLVEDDKFTRQLLRERFEDTYEIIETGDAKEALALALQHKPDCILLDLTLPGFSGFELCQTLASLNATRLTPIFIITAKPAKEYKESCLNLGAADYFEKPVDFARLRACLDAVIKSKPTERRSQPRVGMAVILGLTGEDASGKRFEALTASDDVSAGGFLASCAVSLKTGSIVEVHLAGKQQRYVGRARVVRVEWPDTPWQRYGFQFVENPPYWILQ